MKGCSVLHAKKNAAGALLASALLAALALPVLAQPEAADKMPPMRSEGALQYACGGIGFDESTAMRAAMKDYPLSLLFAAKDGEYLADIQVEVKGARDSYRFTADGPVCLLQLPEGTYSVQATARNGQARSLQTHVGKERHSLDFRF
jgi:opacity protein-like surface antigen